MGDGNGRIDRPQGVGRRPGRRASAWGGVCASTALVAADAQPAHAAQQAGWVQDGDGWWYAHEGSGYATGWERIGGEWYLFDGSGWMLTGWQQVGGEWYYLKASGAMATGWQQVGGQWYWLGADGAMRTGWYQVGGEWNWSDASGAWHANSWVSDSRGWWYSWADGTYPASSWQIIGGKWYLFDGAGYMRTGWASVGGEWYYLNGDGSMATGWKQVGGAWYYLKGSGAMAAGEWAGDYWLTSSGAMATDAWVDGGRYYVGVSGAWVPGMQPSTPDKPSQPEEKVVTLDQPSDFRYEIRESGAFIVGINYDVWDANGWWNDRVKPKVVIPARIEGKEVVSVETYNAPYGLFALDVSGCLETLEKLDASGNSLETLNLSGCTALKRLDCSGNCLASLELLNCPSLEVLECRANQLESLQIDSERLRSLDCSYNQLSLLGISDCNFAYSRFGNHYGTLNISNNKFTSLGFDLSNFGGSITCYGNNFDSETKAVLKAWGERDGNTLDW